MSVDEVPKPTIQAPADAIVRITTSADCGESGVIDPGQGGSLHESAERVRAVDHAGAHDRDKRRKLSEQGHDCVARPAPSSGSTPICWNTSRRLSSSQCSTNMPSLTRQISIDRISTAFPLAGMPISAPVWVPR